jgi:RNA polymerase sigma-70 factor (ECF subfamily)
MVTSDDSHLMRRIDRREAGALHELYQHYHAPVYRYLMSVLDDAAEAEDVMQDIYLTLWKGPRRWRSQQGRLLNWLIAVARNRAVDRLRRHTRQADAAPLESDSTPDLSDDQRAVRDLLAQLPADQRQALFDVFFLGMNDAEVAQDLHITPEEARRRLRSGIQSLRALWQESTQ